MKRPLEGLKVIDLTTVLAGPFCTYQLALLGAEVTKIEIPGSGDLARQLGGDSELNSRLAGASFLAQNASKRSLTINLKDPRGPEILMQLARKADILVENFRPGVMDRLGVGWKELHDVRRELVYCSLTGFGQSGPWSKRPAYDQVIQGLSGIMSVTGSADGPPLRAGYPVCDTFGGMTAAFAIVAAALGAQRTGEGSYIDVSLLDAAITSLGWVVSNLLIALQQSQRMGNDNFTSSPSGAFQAQDRLINIAANEDKQFSALCVAIDRPDLLRDARFTDREKRKQNRSELNEELNRVLKMKSAEQWFRQMGDEAVPVGPVLELGEILEQDQVKDRDLMAHLGWCRAAGRNLTVLSSGFMLDGTRPTPTAPPPALGEHSYEVLSEIGLTPDEISDLHTHGVI